MPKGKGRVVEPAPELAPGLPADAYENPPVPRRLKARSPIVWPLRIVAVLCIMGALAAWGLAALDSRWPPSEPIAWLPPLVQELASTMGGRVTLFSFSLFAATLCSVIEALVCQREMNERPRTGATIIHGRAVKTPFGNRGTQWPVFLYGRVHDDPPDAPLRLLVHPRSPHQSESAAAAYLQKWLERREITVALDPRWPKCAFPVPWRYPELGVAGVILFFSAVLVLGAGTIARNYPRSARPPSASAMQPAPLGSGQVERRGTPSPVRR